MSKLNIMRTIIDRSTKLITVVPTTVAGLLQAKQEDRILYLKTMSQDTLISTFKWFTYVLLAGNLMHSANKLHIEIPAEVQLYLESIESECSDRKITVTLISEIVDAQLPNLSKSTLIQIILFGATLIINPDISAKILLSSILLQAALYFTNIKLPSSFQK
ncbi:hypothetical protein PTI45_04495 [Paenibacillus nuruki]|uniref:Uncharacterized protein n=1 Tax=Paenibacillus nuruki TaxID=1886670 RepID=A0A1E3KXN7_9BACL|nr:MULTISPECIES: hypothetical protein [Paenibacillus]ODP26153.1 hypothetical protein PTI45_04495 [Paenibacillus nuruki]TKJ83827.1 hypothetical protein PaeCFBP13512_22160 [Paenibacillus sp. CFBP13512]